MDPRCPKCGMPQCECERSHEGHAHPGLFDDECEACERDLTREGLGVRQGFGRIVVLDETSGGVAVFVTAGSRDAFLRLVDADAADEPRDYEDGIVRLDGAALTVTK